jgi:general secretion pathway protein D
MSWIAVAGLCVSQGAFAQEPTITPNYKDADLNQIVEAVSMITGKNFIVDPRVRAQVTMLSATAMPPEAFYQAFLSILQVHGFVAVPAGNVIKIIPDANARQVPGDDLPDRISSTSDEIVTQVIGVKNVSAVQLVPILRPLIPQYGQLAAYPAANMLIISDRANNVSRIQRIIQRIDQEGDDAVPEIVQLQNATAGDIVRVVNSLYAGNGQDGLMTNVKLVADDRTNSVLISGEKSQRLRLKTLITTLDTPLESGGDTMVRYLEYADAETMVKQLKEALPSIAKSAGGPPGPPGAPGSAPAPSSVGAATDGNATIWADAETNALVITAPPKLMRSFMSIVDKLDIRRLQVQVEAILVELTASKAAELGINAAVFDNSGQGTVPIGLFNSPVGGTSIGSIAAAVANPGAAALSSAALPNGVTLGGGRFPDSGVNFAVLLRALRNDANSNIISTPSIVTLDNQEAEIKVAREIPFITGQFTNTGGNNNGSVNPFQTIQREEVGTILKITPQINKGNAVVLKIEQEDSSVTGGVMGAVDLVTNKRTISTKVLVEDGGLIVLGGLTSNTAIEGESRVPLLGSIPLLGNLFKTRNGSKEKRNLMLFIRPTILRDDVSAAIESNSKYNAIRGEQLKRNKGKVTLLPGVGQPTLPPIEDLTRYPNGQDATSPEAPPSPEANPSPSPGR